MNHKQEFDETGGSLARLIRRAEEYYRLLENAPAPKEDPTRAKRAKAELDALHELEQNFKKAWEIFEKEDKHLAELEKKAREQAEKDAAEAERHAAERIAEQSLRLAHADRAFAESLAKKHETSAADRAAAQKIAAHDEKFAHPHHTQDPNKTPSK